MAVTPLLLAHSQDIRASIPAKAVRGHTVENVSVCNKTQCVFVCVKMTVTRELPRWWVSAQHHRQQRRPHPDAIGRRRILVKHSTLPHHSDQSFLFSLPCPPPGFSPAFLFRLSHLRLASTHQCFILQHFPALHLLLLYTLGLVPWLQPLTPQTGGLPLGFLENHLPLSERQVPAQNTTAAELIRSQWP